MIEKAPKFEGGAGSESLEKQKTRVANAIQVRLMGMMCNPEAGDDCFNNWAEQYGKRFRDLFEIALVQHTDMLNEWDMNPDKYTDIFFAELLPMPGESEGRLAA